MKKILLYLFLITLISSLIVAACSSGPTDKLGDSEKDTIIVDYKYTLNEPLQTETIPAEGKVVVVVPKVERGTGDTITDLSKFIIVPIARPLITR